MINKVTQKEKNKKIYKAKIKFKVLHFSKHHMILHYFDIMTLHLEMSGYHY